MFPAQQALVGVGRQSWAREGLPYTSLHTLFKSKKELKPNIPFGLLQGGKVMLKKHIWLTTKVTEDPSANATACEAHSRPSTSSTLRLRQPFVADAVQTDFCNLGWHVQVPGFYPA